MAIPGKDAWNRSFYGHKLTAEANSICFSRRQSRRMRMKVEGLRPFRAILRFFDNLRAAQPPFSMPSRSISTARFSIRDT